MADYNEYQFEKEICEHLADTWLAVLRRRRPATTGTARSSPRTSSAGCRTRSPTSWPRSSTGSGDSQKQTDMLLDRRRQSARHFLWRHGGGTLHVLRNGARISALAIWNSSSSSRRRPPTRSYVERYAKMRVRVMRQVHFSPDRSDGRSLDLVFFVNGIPVATARAEDRLHPVDRRRDPAVQDPTPQGRQRSRQSLLGFGTRALVHFAVSNDEVWMTTKLAGPKTHFLPFNMGYDGGKGNPPATYVEGKAATSASSYLWEMVLERDSWLNDRRQVHAADHQDGPRPDHRAGKQVDRPALPPLPPVGRGPQTHRRCGARRRRATGI